MGAAPGSLSFYPGEREGQDALDGGVRGRGGGWGRGGPGLDDAILVAMERGLYAAL